MNDITYQPQPETLIAELGAVESLFMMRLGVTMNCGDIRLIKIDDGKYVVQELRHRHNGTAQYQHLQTHTDIAAAVIAFRAAILGPAKRDTVEFDEATGTVSIRKE